MDLLYHVSGYLGAAHLVVAILAILFGTIVLCTKKGTTNHKRTGYAYSLCMILVIVSAFLLYNLTGKFNVFHVAAIVSAATLIAGLVPVFLKKPAKGYMEMHLSYMYWSVIGLYGAFVSETFVRIPSTPFWGMVGFGTALVMLIGGFVFATKKAKWEAITHKN